MTIRALSEVFIPGAAALAERLRTLTVTPTRFVEPGSTVEATFGFYNSGGATATGLRVRFAMPEGLHYIPGSARVDGIAIGEADGIVDGAFVSPSGAVLGEIGPGVERRVTLLYRVANLIEDGTTLTLQAAIAANETTIVGSNIVRLVARSRPLLDNPQTLLTIEAPSGPEPGRELLIRARLTNLGQSSANDVVLGLPVPEHTRYSSRSARIDGRPVVDEHGTPFEISASIIVAERLAPGESVIADFIAVIETPLDNGTPISATARISSREVSEFEITSNDISVSSMPSFDGDGTAFIIAGDDEVVPGMRLRMTVRAANVGTSSARRVFAQLTMPTGLVYSPGSATLDGLPLGDDLFESMTYTFESVAPGRAAELAFDAVVVAPAPPDAKLPVAAQLSWENGERTFNRTLTIRSEPRFTRVKNIVERAGPPLAQPNEEVSFVVHVVNEGTAEASDVILHLRADESLTLISAQSSGRLLPILDGSITLGSLPPHIEQLITVTARTVSPIPDRAEVALGAELETRQLGAIDLGIASYTIRSRPRFSIEESCLELRTSEPLRASRSVQIAVRLVNTGTDVARDVHAIFNYPPELAIEPLGGAPLINGELIFDAIPPGAMREAIIDVRLAGFVPNGSSLSFEARIETQTLTPLPLRPVLIETRAEAEFAGEIELITTPSDAVDAGAPLLHMLRFRNVGDGPAQSIVVRVRPPERVVYIPASTVVNDMRIDDEGGASPLWALHGLILTDVDPGVPVSIRWETIVTSPIASGTVLSSSATLQWDEQSLTVVSPDVIVRSSPEFASSPGGRSISIARLAARSTQDVFRVQDEPQALPRPRPVASAPVLDHAPQPAIPAPETFSADVFTAAPESAAAPSFDEAPPSFSKSDFPDTQNSQGEHPEPVLDEELDLPFFTAPPSAVAEEEVESSFSYLEDEEPPMPAFAEPPASQAVTAAAEHTSTLDADLFVAEPPGNEPAPGIVEFSAPRAEPEPEEPQDEPVYDDAPIAQPEPREDAFVAEPIVNEEATETVHPPSAAHLFETPVVAEEIEAAPVIDEVARAREQRTVSGPVTLLTFAPDRLRRTLTLLQKSDSGKLISHVFALQEFFPDRIVDEPELDELFTAVRDAFRSTLDRLFVRLRLPRYAITARDLEDRSCRDALVNLAERVTEISIRDSSVSNIPLTNGGIRIKGPIDRASLDHALEGLNDAPIGGVTPWIACVALLGTTIEASGTTSEALASYRRNLDRRPTSFGDLTNERISPRSHQQFQRRA